MVTRWQQLFAKKKYRQNLGDITQPLAEILSRVPWAWQFW
jgi:hypothetical protein